jgi:hypothetical protein
MLVNQRISISSHWRQTLNETVNSISQVELTYPPEMRTKCLPPRNNDPPGCK